MSLKNILPKGEISKEMIQDLAPVFEGEQLHKKQEYGAAVKKYQQALGSFPVGSSGRFMIYNKLGIVFEKLNQLDQAIAIYKQCAEEGSITPFTYERLARLHLEIGKHGTAVDYCNKGLKSLKLAKTDLFQEIYFQIRLRIIKLKANH
jgi:tetratricopeptide (TPR) repeat protein